MTIERSSWFERRLRAYICINGFCISSRAIVVESPWPVKQTVSGGSVLASLESERIIAASSPPERSVRP